MTDALRPELIDAPARRLVVVHPDPELLEQAVAARLLTRILDVQSQRRPVHLVATGGSTGIGVLAAAAASPLRQAIDWTGVHVWWGDERYLPDGDPDRNETQAREALFDALIAAESLPERNLHPMLGPSQCRSAVASAEQYRAELARFAGRTGPALPAFDVLLLGMGPDGHIASLFPGRTDLLSAPGLTCAVSHSPKPPPTRVSLTLQAINAAREVWLVVTGRDKAEKVAAALAGDPVLEVPAAGAHGRERTLYLLDTAAADPPDYPAPAGHQR